MGERAKLLERSEAEIQREILRALPALGVFAWRNQSGMLLGQHKGTRWAVRMGTPGVSDIVGFRLSDGKVVCVEVKRPGQVPTRAQAAFLERVWLAGGVAIVATSVADVMEALHR